MGMFCEKCGSQLKPGAAFCEACGARVRAVTANANNAGSNNISNVSVGNAGGRGVTTAPEGRRGKSGGLMAGVVLLLVLLGGGWYYYQNYMEAVPSGAVVDDASSKKNAEATDNKDKVQKETQNKKAEETPLEKAQKQLSDKGVKGTVIASTIEKHNNYGYLSIVKNGEQYSIITYDLKNQRIGQTAFDKRLLYFTNKKPKAGDSEVVIFDITIFDDTHDADEKSGIWNGNNHLLPVYAFYKLDADDNVIPGMLNTGNGAKPSRFHNYFNEQRNVDTINLFLMDIKNLQENVNKNQVALP
ncbi:zinc ribbon domain-containing protein [Anaerovibrio sp.]|uniref:zinc ribbon domain-containing protein n=1 Tax=Anaerovibrio sp. TaxID=1872532 RepID=UPI003F159278